MRLTRYHNCQNCAPDARGADERPVRAAHRRLHRRRHRAVRLAEPSAAARGQRREPAAGPDHHRPVAQGGGLRHRPCSANGTSASRATTIRPSAASTRRSSTMGKHFDFVTQPKVDYPAGRLPGRLAHRQGGGLHPAAQGPAVLPLPAALRRPLAASTRSRNSIEKFKPKAAAGGHHNPTYAAMIASVDESVGRVMATLDELEARREHGR